MRFADSAIKRAVDIFGASVGLCIFGLPMMLVALAIRFDTPGPSLFKQQRVGRFGRTFSVLKFRTMVEAKGGQVSTDCDPRITRSGAFLRRYKVDELPQFLNVLKGEMSLVGPRPEVPYYVNLYTREQRDTIFSVRPGITDPISLVLIDEAKILSLSSDPLAYYEQVLLPWKVNMQCEYVQSRTLCRDLMIIWRTATNIFSRRRGAWPSSLPMPSSLRTQK